MALYTAALSSCAEACRRPAVRDKRGAGSSFPLQIRQGAAPTGERYGGTATVEKSVCGREIFDNPKGFITFVCEKIKKSNPMANLRDLKKEIDYRLEEVVFDCDMAIAFQPSKEQEIFELMQQAVALRNELIAKVINPTEPHNKSLVRKYYTALRADIVKSFEALFEELSKINEAKKE